MQRYIDKEKARRGHYRLTKFNDSDFAYVVLN